MRNKIPSPDVRALLPLACKPADSCRMSEVTQGPVGSAFTFRQLAKANISRPTTRRTRRRPPPCLLRYQFRNVTMSIYTPRISLQGGRSLQHSARTPREGSKLKLETQQPFIQDPYQFQHGEHDNTKGSPSELLWEDEATTISSISYHMQSSPSTPGHLSQFSFALADSALPSAIAYRLQSDLFQGRGATMLVGGVSGALLGSHLQSAS